MPETTLVDTTGSDGLGLKATLRLPTRQQMHQAAVEATREVFEQLIVPAAKAGSPVGTPPDDKHPGKNRDSISFYVGDDEAKGEVYGRVFTQSGYGWLIEHGTSHNRALTRLHLKRRRGRFAAQDRTPAVPYIYPAVARYAPEIVNRWRDKLEALA